MLRLQSGLMIAPIVAVVESAHAALLPQRFADPLLRIDTAFCEHRRDQRGKVVILVLFPIEIGRQCEQAPQLLLVVGLGLRARVRRAGVHVGPWTHWYGISLHTVLCGILAARVAPN